jgi:hypothetical protein
MDHHHRGARARASVSPVTANFRSNSAQRIAFCLVAAGSAALIVRALVAEPQTVDDLFIFLRYARNLAQRGEYGFNPGERVEGTSSVVWTLALAAAYKAGWRGVGVAKALSFAAAALVPATCALVLRRWCEQRPMAMAVPALALALDADFATWATSGMDTAAWTLSCVVCVALAASRRTAASAFALGALAWVRPEGVLFAVFGVLALTVDRKSAGRLAAFAAAPVVALTLMRLAYFHELLPNTFWAKMNAADGKDYTGLGYLASAVERRPLLLFVLPLMGLRLRLPTCRKLERSERADATRTACRKLERSERADAMRTPSVRLAVALLVASFTFSLVAGGDWMPNRRLLVVALPLASLIGAAGIAASGSRFFSLAGGAMLVVEGALTVDHAVDQRWRDVEWLDDRVREWHLPERPFSGGYAFDWMPTHLLRQIAPYVAPGDVVAHVDVGQLPYAMGNVAFLDGFGLVDRGAGRLAFSPRDPALRDAARESFFTLRPAAAIVVLADGGRPLSPAQDAALQDARFDAGWRELGRVPTWGGHPCVTYVRRDIGRVSEYAANARIQDWLASVPDVVVPL